VLVRLHFHREILESAVAEQQQKQLKWSNVMQVNKDAEAITPYNKMSSEPHAS